MRRFRVKLLTLKSSWSISKILGHVMKEVEKRYTKIQRQTKAPEMQIQRDGKEDRLTRTGKKKKTGCVERQA